jgi:glycosyltransferase involved in cell wall biosynthesis
MRIAFINSTKKWGGVKTWCLDMGTALEAQGHSVWIFGRRGSFVEKACSIGLRARGVTFGFDFNPLLILYFLLFFLARRIDVVVVNVSKDLRTAGVAARLLKRQIVQHVGSAADFEDTPMVRLLQRLLAPRLLCCSEYVRAGILKHVPSLRRQELCALHPGVRVPEEPRSSGNTPPVVISTSQLNADKHHADLLEALGRIKNDNIAFRAIIAGTGSLAGELKARAEALGLGERVEWTGFTTDIPELLLRGDVFVLPTLIEPLGIALQEAMAAGLAPVARAGGGVPEIWPERCREFLVPAVAGPEGLEKALRRLLAMTEEERRGLRRAAWEQARTRFNLPDQAALFAQWMAQASNKGGELRA